MTIKCDTLCTFFHTVCILVIAIIVITMCNTNKGAGAYISPRSLKIIDFCRKSHNKLLSGFCGSCSMLRTISGLACNIRIKPMSVWVIITSTPLIFRTRPVIRYIANIFSHCKSFFLFCFCVRYLFFYIRNNFFQRSAACIVPKSF